MKQVDRWTHKGTMSRVRDISVLVIPALTFFIEKKSPEEIRKNYPGKEFKNKHPKYNVPLPKG